MGFVRSSEEIARIQHTLSHPRFVGAEMLGVDFLTTPELVQSVLPPGLEPADEPRVRAMVGRWRSNCVADFEGGAIYVAARHGELEGDYVLAMYMDRDQPITFGRELFGEPKKQAVSGMRRRGPHMAGWVVRDGIRLIEIEAELTDDHGPQSVDGLNFNYKAMPSCDGIGLEDDAVLTVATFANELTVYRTGSGTVVLRSTANDPLGEIEVVSVLGAAYFEGDLITSCRAAARIPADEFLPYALGRMDDWSLLDTEATRSVLA
jgi:acetoacetate decarboxylase